MNDENVVAHFLEEKRRNEIGKRSKRMKRNRERCVGELSAGIV
jgi:hypothetical protein